MKILNIIKNIFSILIILVFFINFGITEIENKKLFNYLFFLSTSTIMLQLIIKILPFKNGEFNIIEYIKQHKKSIILLSTTTIVLIFSKIFNIDVLLILLSITIALINILKIYLENTIKIKFVNPSALILLSFSIASILGGLILYLPKMHTTQLSLLNAIFISTSAVCVTGLSPLNITETLSHNGILTLLTLIEIGGVGIMSFSAIILFFLKDSTSKQHLFISQSLPKLKGINSKNIVIHIFSLTILIETIGIVFLYFSSGAIENRLFSAIFHSISAFCNAGFSLQNTSMMKFNNNTLYLSTIMGLIFLGGIGFPVIVDILNNFGRNRKFKLNTKISLIVSVALIIIGLLFFMVDNSIYSNKKNYHILNSLFMSITARTAGFNSTILTNISDISYIILIFLMFIGASSGGTGGGVKTNSIAIIFITIINTLKGNKKITVFNRYIEMRFVLLSLSFIFLYLFIAFISIILLYYFNNNIPLKNIVFEVFSALSTVGLSLDTTPKLNDIGKIIIILLMIIGRVGPLVFFFSFLNKTKKGFNRYVKEDILIG